MQPKILFIHPRRGLYQITQCKECNYVFDCENCDAHLVTYRTWDKNMELVCHQCQAYYNFPKKCGECHSHNLISAAPGIDELEVQLQTLYPDEVIMRLDKRHKNIEHSIAATTRIWDPGLDYSFYDKIVLINAHNMLASPDYLVYEDISKSLAELVKATNSDQELILDTKNDSDMFEELVKLNQDGYTLHNWYEGFLSKESKNRELFQFPPYSNIILMTIQMRNKDKSWDNAKILHTELKKQLAHGHDGVSVTYPYPARFLKRKGMFSYHVLLKYPKGYGKFFELRDIIQSLADPYSTQIRLNPKHLF